MFGPKRRNLWLQRKSQCLNEETCWYIDSEEQVRPILQAFDKRSVDQSLCSQDCSSEEIGGQLLSCLYYTSQDPGDCYFRNTPGFQGLGYFEYDGVSEPACMALVDISFNRNPGLALQWSLRFFWISLLSRVAT